MTRDLYHATIVEHDRHPHHEGPLPGATNEATVDNPLCGDVVTFRLKLGAVIEDAAFEARGCSLSRAAASMLAERAIGATPDDVRSLAEAIHAFVHSAPDAPIPSDLGELEAFAGVRAFKSRRTCVTLPFRAAVDALGSR